MYEQYFKIKEKVKRFNYLYMPLLSVFAFALCACQSEKQASGVACVKDVALKANLSGAVSRTTMTDTYGGAFAQTWNNDVLSIYHTYQSNGTAQSLMPLSFTTTATGTSSAVFLYTDLSNYAYNPGQPVYAFNKLTGTGQCTPSVTGIAATPLSLSLTDWASQDGTLTGTQNAALYDAMAGYTTADVATGVPGSLTMNHLGGMVCFHLICDGFTVGTAVSGIQFSDGSASPCCFPGSATVAVTSGGAVTTTPVFTGRWSPSGSFIPYSYTENGVSSKCVDVYLSTFPTTIAGPLTVMLSLGGYAYSGIVSPSYVLASSKVKVIPISLVKGSALNDSSNLFAWDATDSQPVTLKTAPTNANTTTVASSTTDYSSRALYACKNCPNYYEISWYLKAGCYWDDGSGTNGGNTIAYKMADGNSTTAGMWFKKKSALGSEFSSTSSSGVESCTPTALTAALAISQHLSSDYFFLPAAGYTVHTSGAFYNGGTEVCYWSSTPSSNTTNAYRLHFSSTGVYLSFNIRTYGFCLWTAQ